jgi:hypothetical protein
MKLQIPMTKVLNKILFNRNYPCAVTYGPLEFGGLGIPYIYVEQGIAKISLVTRHMSSGSELGKSLILGIRVSQLEAGVSWDILEKPGTIPHLTQTWITALSDFMAPHDIKIILCPMTKWTSYSLTCENGSFIMDHILKSKRFTAMELGDINRVRIFYRALAVSNIANAAGTKIDEAYYSMDRPARQDHSTWRSSTQPAIHHLQAARSLGEGHQAHDNGQVQEPQARTRKMDGNYPPTRTMVLCTT